MNHLIFLLFAQAGWAFTPINSDLVASSCRVSDEFQRGSFTVQVFDSQGNVIREIGAPSGDSFVDESDAKAALRDLQSRHICPETE